jgi:hypothetical protein
MQSRLEVPDAQPGEASLHAVHDSCALADQILALTVRAPTIFLLKCWDRDQAAMIRLTAEPTDEDALEKLSVEPIRLRPPVLARHGDARRMDDVGFEAACPQPPSQPEAVTAGLEREGDPSDRPASLHRLVPPPLDQLQQCLLVRIELLQRVALDAGHNPSNEPAGLAHVDHGNESAFLMLWTAPPPARECHGCGRC